MPTPTRSGQRRRTHLQLVSLRINEGLSREQLAYRSGVGKETIRLAESGFLPTPRVQFALAGVFGLRPLDLWPIEAQKAVAR
jgi:transcriptional regulator with XRE-family HTH domain